MESNGKLLQELVSTVRELRSANEEQRRANDRYDEFLRGQRRANEGQRRANEGQRRANEEHRQEHKVMERRWQKLFFDHEKWMREMAVRLGTHYKLIQDTRDKLR